MSFYVIGYLLWFFRLCAVHLVQSMNIFPRHALVSIYCLITPPWSVSPWHAARDGFHTGWLFSMLMKQRWRIHPPLINKSRSALDTRVCVCLGVSGHYCATNSPCLLTHWPNETPSAASLQTSLRFSAASLSSIIRHIDAGNRWLHLGNSGVEGLVCVVFNVLAV